MNFRDLDPLRFADRVGGWLAAGGPDDDVVVSCRLRLARNVDEFPFVARLDTAAAERLRDSVRGVLEQALGHEEEAVWVPIEDAPTVLRLLLRERHLASRDLAPTDDKSAPRGGRAVVFASSETLSVMVNEEDHLRLQAFSPGLDLDGVWGQARELDRTLEGALSFAHTEKLGYLTGCPTNVGTGLRASVMLHLPALSLVHSELEKVFAAAQRTGLAVRGMYGEGSRAAGDFYQISNQITLGRSEEELVGDLRSLVPSIVDFERRVRRTLLEERPNQIHERVTSSLATLGTARSMATEEALAHLSQVRLGACTGILDGVDARGLTPLAIRIQKGHLQANSQASFDTPLLDPSARDELRARLLRRAFAV